ncbi:MAG TPA: TonB family protein [Longimicrobium sp.]|nr:TonB family protein [Longimicrobium sp.]
MFKVLSGEKKRRVISPATIIASVATHLLLLGGALFAAGGEALEVVPPEEDSTTIIWRANDPTPPLPVIKEQPAQAQPDEADETVEASTQGNQEEVPDVRKAPDGIQTEEPGAVPVDLSRHTGQGRPGNIPGPPTGDPRPPAGDGVDQPRAYPLAVVEERPVLDRSGMSRALERNYPAVLRDSRVSGRVLIELVVDENGRPVPGSARIIEASHPAFGEATLRVAERFRFRPAKIDGTPVPVVVTIPILWTTN